MELHLTDCVTQSLFFKRFSRGILHQMGKDIRSNTWLYHKVSLRLMDNTKKEIERDDVNYDRKRFLVLVAMYLVVCFGSSLCGREGFIMEVSDLLKFINRGKYDPDIPFVVVPLLGQFKVEIGERSHLLMMVNVTFSGLQIRK